MDSKRRTVVNQNSKRSSVNGKPPRLLLNNHNKREQRYKDKLFESLKSPAYCTIDINSDI